MNGALGPEDTQLLLARLEELELQAWGGAAPPGAAGGPEEAIVEARPLRFSFLCPFDLSIRCARARLTLCRGMHVW